MRHLIAFVTGLLVLGLIGYWGSKTGKMTGAVPATSPTIVWVNPLVGHPVYVMQTEAFRVAARDYGFEPVCVGPARIDAESMVQEIENAIAQRVAGIITVPFSWSAFEGVFRKAHDAGIPVVCTGVDTPAEWRLAFIGTDNAAYGRLAAEHLIAKKKGRARICIMMSQLDVQNQVEQRRSFEAALAGRPDMKVVMVESDKADMAAAVEKFQDVFRAYPDIDTVLMLEATGGTAAAKVAGEMGLADRLTILAIDDVKETVDCIRKGTVWATLAQNFYRMGYESAAMIMDRLADRTVPSQVDSGVVLVTQENEATYKRDMIGAVRRKAGAPPAWSP